MIESKRSGAEKSAHDARWLRLLLDVAEIANDNKSLENTVCSCLRRVCEFNGWHFGYCHVVDGGREFWWSEEGRVKSLLELEPELRELVSSWTKQVMDLECARHVNDFAAEVENETAASGEALSSGGAIAVPLSVGAGSVGAMAFFSRHPLDRSLLSKDPAGLLNVMESMGGQVGRSIERWQLLRRIAEEAERERTSLGREIHDNLAQQLVGVKLLAQNLRRKMGDRAEEHVEEWELLISNVIVAQDQARALARGLSAGLIPSGEDALADRLEDLCEVVRTGHGLDCHLKTEGSIAIQDDLTRAHLWHIAREAVFNALRHADPSRIDLQVIADNDQIRLEIRDDGSGFPDTTGDPRGMGLSSMRHRAELIGGRLELQTIQDEGTVVRCVLPLD